MILKLITPPEQINKNIAILGKKLEGDTPDVK